MKFLFVFLVLALPVFAATFPSDGSPGDVQAKVDLAADGDTVTIPAGTFTWASGVVMSGKGVHLQGAGAARTIAYSASSVAVGSGAKTFVLASTRAKATLGSYFSVTPGQTLKIWRTGGSIGWYGVSGEGVPVWMQGTVTSYTPGTATLVMNITSTSGGSATHSIWTVVTNPTTVVEHNYSSGALINITEDVSHHVEISDIYFNSNGGVQPGRMILVNETTNAKPALIHDLFVRTAHDSTTPYTRDVNGILLLTPRGLIWNCSFLASVASSAPFAIFHSALDTTTSWTTLSTMGTGDTTGVKNLYVEDCDFTAFLSWGDFSENVRSVIRNCFFNQAGIACHGNDSGIWGMRHCEVYDSEWAPYPVGSGISLSHRILSRGGTWVVTDNVAPDLGGLGLGAAEFHFAVWALSATFGSYGAGDGGDPDYPAPRQSGFGYVTGLGGDIGGKYRGDSEPIYIWNNTPENPSVSISDGGNLPPDPDNVADYGQSNRDWFIGIAKPGWTKPTGAHASAYPHPLRTDATQVVAPSFSPVAGSYGAAQNVTITSATGGATIRYTTNGSTPTSSSGTVYASPVAISTTTTLKAIAYNGVLSDSSVTTGVYTITGQVAAPTFNPVAGSYGSAQNVTITSATGGATIRYTVDGSTPTSSSGTVYSSPVAISVTTTLKAIAYNGVVTDSTVTSGLYTIITTGADLTVAGTTTVTGTLVLPP